jgi:adenylosuccinate lyase
VIARYTRPQIGRVWSDERRLEAWLAVELAALDAWVRLGVVPAEAVAEIRARARVDVERARAIERRTHHDVVAFTESVAEQVGPAARWFHYGLTSSDVVDTGLALQLRDASVEILAGLDRAVEATWRRAEEHRRTPCMGRTHGVHAEPTSFGLKLLGWVCELDRDRRRLASAFADVAVGKVSGAVGAYGNVDPRVETDVCEALGLDVEPVSTQVVARDRHAALLSTIALCGSSLDRFATEIRHLQRTEVREAEEPFAAGQKGSSAMPHKRNPITCERISGLARVLRGNALVGLENVPLWHERDISHSSAERIVLADSTILLDYLLDRFAWVMEGLVVRPEQMRRNIDGSHGLPFSGRVLLALVEAGMTREEAYAVVQPAAMRAWETGEHLRDVLAGTREELPASASVDPAVLDAAFDLERALAHVDEPFVRVRERLGLEREAAGAR